MSISTDRLKPTQKQLDFLDWEFGAFFHFGLRSFYKGFSDWDARDMDEKVFNPLQLDCESWIREFKDAGAAYAILVCKHHDGFANWPSKYSDYSVANTPWKGGKGDVVQEFVNACHKFDMKLGFYYSPAQRDWSKFENNDDYDDYFIAQVSELLQNYGKVDYLWFDGCGSEGHDYNKDRIVKAIRTLQPEILIFSMWDPDTKWIGNEGGWAPLPNFNTVSALHFSMNATELDTTTLSKEKFLPGECDTDLRSTWFDCEDNEDTIYDLEELMGLYYMSVGRGANFLLNIGPDARGLLPEPDVARLREFGAEIKRRFGAHIEKFGAVTKNDEMYHIKSNERTMVNHVIIKENLVDGEAVTGFKLYSDDCLIYTGYNIGHKAICMFPTVKTSTIKLEITTSLGECVIDDMKAYFVK